KRAPEVDALSTEELAVARPRSAFGKIVAVASVALVGGGLFTAMSARLSATPNSTHAMAHLSAAPQPPRAALSAPAKPNTTLMAAALTAPPVAPTTDAAPRGTNENANTNENATPNTTPNTNANTNAKGSAAVASKTVAPTAREHTHHPPSARAPHASTSAAHATSAPPVAHAKKTHEHPKKREGGVAKKAKTESAKPFLKGHATPSSKRVARAADHGANTGRTTTHPKPPWQRAEPRRPSS
ncbi:MAG TPA: hypothetical protein VM925_31070, partial [Labilithrix sp.]|nr:hypothetical protein [Labilithrix sp.]